MVDHELIADLGDEQFDVQSSGPGGDQGHLNAVVRYEIGAGDADPAARVLEEGGEQLQVVVVLEARSARHHLHVQLRGVEFAQLDVADLGEQQLIALAVPIGDEDSLDLTHGRALDPAHQLLPVQPTLDVLLLVVVVDDQVLRADEADQAVDDDQLAVVAEVRPPVVLLERLDRQHRQVVRAHRLEASDRPLAVRVGELGDVIGQHPDLHSSGAGTLAGFDDRGGPLVIDQDEELDVDIALSGVDRIGHGLDRFPIHRVQLGGVAADHR